MRCALLSILAACGSTPPSPSPPPAPTAPPPEAATPDTPPDASPPEDDEFDAPKGPCFVLTLDTHHVPEPVGDAVAMRVFDPPKACTVLAPRRPAPPFNGPQDVPNDHTGVHEYASQQEFKRRFRCSPGAFDFKTHRLAVAWGDTSGDSRYTVERAVAEDNGVTLVVGITPECAPPARISPASLVELPRVDGDVGLVLCPRPNPACPDR